MQGFIPSMPMVATHTKKLSFLFGVENLTNTLYAYHLSRNSVAINMLDNPVNTRVYEPGRNFWLKIQAYF